MALTVDPVDPAAPDLDVWVDPFADDLEGPDQVPGPDPWSASGLSTAPLVPRQQVDAAAMAQLAEQVRPVALADQQVLPVLPALEPLVPWDGLQRGITVGVAGRGATSLAMALAAGPSAAGSWIAAVGFGGLGLAAAAEIGVDLRHLALVTPPEPAEWATVVAALVGAFDLILLHPTHRVNPAEARRLTSRARERGTILIDLGGAGPATGLDAPDLEFRVVCQRWEGLGPGHGHLRSRTVRVEASGRRQAARPRTGDLWLLDPDGRVAPAAISR